MIQPLRTVWLLVLTAILLTSASAALEAADAPAPDEKEVKAMVAKATEFFKKRQGTDGSFSPKFVGPGITALVAASLVRNGVSADDPVLAKALEYLTKNVQKDGGIYEGKMPNYITSVALIAFSEANTKGQYDTLVKNAVKFLKTIQFDESTVEEKDVKYGGVSYGGKERPDLSNTQYFVEALLAAGVPKSDPSIQRALKFISRCQNLPGETNDQPFAKKTTADDKGGLVYNPIPTEKGKDVTPEGGLRSSGAMTYAGLKSFLHAGVSKDDKRVLAAVDWIRRHYSVEDVAGQGTSGLYYYYHTFGKSMAALGEDEFTDSKGVKRPWRQDLVAALKKRQKEDGSWANENPGFMENNPDLSTAFALLALSYTKPAKK